MKADFIKNLSYSSAVLRLVLALVIFPHGAQKMLGWFGGFGFEGTMNYFTGTVGLPYALGVLVILIEFCGPILLILGSFTRVTAAATFFLFGGILITSHLDNGFFMNWFGNQPGEGYEFDLLVLAMSLALTIQGPGKITITKFSRKLDLLDNVTP